MADSKLVQDGGPTDGEVIDRVLAGEIELFEVLMRRYNQRVYRVARGVLRTDAEAEDLAQEAWVRAYEHLGDFGGRAAFSTWLTRIVLHEGWARARRERRFEEWRPEEEDGEGTMKQPATAAGPESEALDGEIRSMLETAVESLPETYRTVFILRDVEELSTAETAECLELSEEAVKTRLHRARATLRRELLALAGGQARQAFPFLGKRCDGMVARVLDRLRHTTPQ
jgi:RNA polymerase sigma-70 factor (ECF subfamily)